MAARSAAITLLGFDALSKTCIAVISFSIDTASFMLEPQLLYVKLHSIAFHPDFIFLI